MAKHKRTMDCGCVISLDYLDHDETLTILYCHKHNAAPELYEACKQTLDFFHSEIITEWMESETMPYFKELPDLVKAIAKAEGR